MTGGVHGRGFVVGDGLDMDVECSLYLNYFQV